VDDPVLKKLHRALFASSGRKLTIKKNIRKFCGFPDASKSEFEARLTKLEKGDLRAISDLVDARVPSAQNKQETVTGLVDFFLKPKAGKEQTGGTYKRRSTSKKGKGSKKGSKGKGKGKKEGKKRGITGYILFSNETRPKLKKKDPNLNFTEVAQALSKKWKKLDDDEKEEFNKRAKK